MFKLSCILYIYSFVKDDTALRFWSFTLMFLWSHKFMGSSECTFLILR